MPKKSTLIILLSLLSVSSFAQSSYSAVNIYNEENVEVRTSYNAGSNSTLFSAYNKAEYPVFLHIYFNEVSRLSFHEKQPFIKKLPHGLTDLFVLDNSRERNLPRFPFKMKTYPSNPLAEINREYPYLLPLREGEVAIRRKVDNSSKELSVFPNPKEGVFYGFQVEPGQEVCACRKGVVVDIHSVVTAKPGTDFQDDFSYITLLHEDGTLATYFNVETKGKTLQPNQTIFPGEVFCNIDSHSNKLIVTFYYNRLFSDDFIFLGPRFQLSATETNILSLDKEYQVVHPKEIRALEMTKKEKKKSRKNVETVFCCYSFYTEEQDYLH